MHQNRHEVGIHSLFIYASDNSYRLDQYDSMIISASPTVSPMRTQGVPPYRLRCSLFRGRRDQRRHRDVEVQEEPGEAHDYKKIELIMKQNVAGGEKEVGIGRRTSLSWREA